MSGEPGTRQQPFEPDPGTGGKRKRNSCKVIVIGFDGRVLLTRNRDALGDFFLLPGGGQRFGETLRDAARREVLEETGYSVDVGRLLLVRDYIARNHEFCLEEGDVHQVEFMFEGRILDGRVTPDTAAGGSSPDAWQTGFEWVPVEDLATFAGTGDRRIYPSVLAGLIPMLARGESLPGTYLGDVN
ncbi:NUDIX domain-containing protein [Candidatus Fermentibacterales bacterium]|nr:NUDIX domain-containing protein [Candidatus Fermentibacterales bacterium]